MNLILAIPVLLFSVVVHEVAHAWQALREGDPTARDLGRITLNPLRHLDLMGSIVVPVLLVLSNAVTGGNFIFGWAKPVPVNPLNYRSPRGGDIRVSLAGIVANLGLAVVCAAGLALVGFLARAGALSFDGALAHVAGLLSYGVLINLVLAWFNLMPIPPLDGSHVLAQLLPPRLAARYRHFGRYGILVLIAAMFVFRGAFGAVLAPVFAVFEWVLQVTLG